MRASSIVVMSLLLAGHVHHEPAPHLAGDHVRCPRDRLCEPDVGEHRGELRAVTLFTPASVTPRRMKGATVAGKSMPCARPHAATAPSAIVCAHAFASVWLPTESTTAAQRSFCRGLPGWDSVARSTISFAPSDSR